MAVLVFWEFPNQVPQAGWLRHQTFIFFHLWRLKVQDPGVGRPGSLEASLLGVWMAIITLCPLCVSKSLTRTPVK